jgi:peptidylprolyl isomerase/peptidyl-prolyl cis-trans isomerase C
MAQYSHILVRHNYEAEDILKLLKEGKPFPELARRFSICRSAADEGRLGEIPLNRTSEDFAEAATSLQPGTYTQAPVRTPSGYHIIFRDT